MFPVEEEERLGIFDKAGFPYKQALPKILH
jgi:hypothetical protein